MSQIIKNLFKKNCMYVNIVNVLEEKFCKKEVSRYILNGLVATLVHFSVLTVNMQVFEMRSAAVANGFASIIGIAVSFLGSKFYVFRKYDGRIAGQAMAFFLLYACISCVHIGVLFFWSDFLGFKYQVGFIIALFVQVVVSFFGNKLFVFR